MKKAIIFDLDGTLFDTLEDICQAVNYTLNLYNLKKRSINEIKSFIGNGNLRLMSLSLGKKNLKYLNEAYKIYIEYYKNHILDNIKLYNNVIKLLDKLKDKEYKIGVVSNKFDAGVNKICSKYLTKYSNTFIGEQEGLNKKPAFDMIELALKKLNIKKEEAIYVGDSEVDIKTALNNNMDLIGCDWGYRGAKIFLDHNVKVAYDPLDILDLIESFN